MTPIHQTQSDELEDGLYVVCTCVRITRPASTDEALCETGCLVWVVWKEKNAARIMTHERELGRYAAPVLKMQMCTYL